MATKREIFEDGVTRGYNIASWQDLPEIGAEMPKHIDWQGIGTISNIDDAHEAFLMICNEAEGNDRQFTPFEFMAKELNELVEKKPYDPWDVFEEGINKGFEKNWRERKDHYE